MKQHRSLLSSLLKGQRLSLAVMLLCMVFISLLAFFPQQIIRYTVDVVLAGGPSFLPVFLENMIRTLGGNTVLGCLAVSALAMVAVALINIHGRGGAYQQPVYLP